MSNTLTELNVIPFLDRFYHCYDGVIHSIHFDMSGGAKNYSAMVLLDVNDATQAGERIRLKLMLNNISECRIRHENRGFIQVLSFGLAFLFTPDKLYIDFTTDTLEDAAQAQQSDLYFVVSNIEWAVVE